jgi:hypothetical protein
MLLSKEESMSYKPEVMLADVQHDFSKDLHNY